MGKIMVILVAALFLTTGCATKSPSVTPAQPEVKILMPTTQPSEPAPVIAEEQTIEIANFSFTPKDLQILKGTKVTWVNNDVTSHIIKSDLFESPLLKDEDTFSYTFKTPGAFTYFCSIHNSMNGMITVIEPPAPDKAESAPVKK